MRTRWSARSARPRLEHLESRETPTAGLLDPSFGTGGLVVSSVGESADSLAVQPNGKILVGGTIAPNPTLPTSDRFDTPAVFRFNPNGTIDGGFHSDTAYLKGRTGFPGAKQILFQPGKGVVVLDGGSLIRLDTHGHADLSFGTGGVASVPAGLTGFNALEMYNLNGGKIAVVGFTLPLGNPPFQFEVVHYTADGKIDPTGGSSGVVRLVPPAGASLAGGTVLPNGKVLAIARSTGTTSSPLTILRYNADGSLDRTFNHTGTSTFSAPPGLFQSPLFFGNFTVQSDGKILISDGSSGKLAVVRLKADGTLDTAFGTGGFTAVLGGGSVSSTPLIAVQSDGKILLAASDKEIRSSDFDSHDTVTLVRLTKNGLPDPGFGADGVVVTDLAGMDMLSAGINALLLQPDGKVLVAGNFGQQLALAAYLTTNVTTASAASSTTLTEWAGGLPFTDGLTATVTGAGKPTGTVTFLEGTTILGAAAVGADGQATILTSVLTAGTHHYTAVYSGDAVNKPSSATGVGSVAKTFPQVTLSASDTAPPFGKPVTLTADVWGDIDRFPIPVGSVTFRDGTKVLGSVPLSKGTSSTYPPTATLTLNNISPGAHHFTAQYSGDANFEAGATSTIAVTVATPVVSTTKLSAPTTTATGQKVTFAATVTDPKGFHPSGKVAFFDGSTNLATVPLAANGTAHLTWALVGPGTHQVQARYISDNGDLPSNSALARVIVTKATTTLVVSASPSVPVAGHAFRLSALVGSSVPGEVLGTGTVTFTEGTHTLGTGQVSKGAASLLVASLTVGKHTITATYAGDANHKPVSAFLVVIVSPAPLGKLPAPGERGV